MINLFSHQPAGGDPAERLAEDIIAQAGLKDLPPADSKFLKENLILQVNRRLGQIIIANLDSAGLAEYDDLLAAGPIPNTEKLEILMRRHIPDYQAKIQAGLDEFIEQAVASLSK